MHQLLFVVTAADLSSQERSESVLFTSLCVTLSGGLRQLYKGHFLPGRNLIASVPSGDGVTGRVTWLVHQ